MSQSLSTEITNLFVSGSAFGWAFPAFLVWWSGALVFATLLAGLDLLIRTVWVRRQIRRLTAKLNELQQPGSRMLPSRLESIETILKSDSVLGPGWLVFKEGLVREPQNNGETVTYLTRHAAESFDPGLVEHKIPAFHRVIPATLTSVGLLGTFLALLFGLHGVRVDTETPLLGVPQATAQPAAGVQGDTATGHVAAAGEAVAAPGATVAGANEPAERSGRSSSRIQGIDTLVNSLSGKFLSSIVALFLAILYALFEAGAERSLAKALDRFCRTLDSLFARRTPEALLIAIHEQIASQSASFRSFNTDLSGHLRQGFQESVGPTLENLNETLSDLSRTSSESLDRLNGTLGEIARSSSQSLGEVASSISKEFHSNLTSAAFGEFEEMRKTLSATGEMLVAMNEQSRTMQNAIQSLIAELDRSRREQAEGLAAQQQTLQEVLRGFSDHLRGMTADSSSALKSSVQQLLEQTGQWSTQTASGLGALLEQQARSFEDRSAQLLDRLSLVAEQMSRASTNGSEQMAGTIANVVGRLEESARATAAILSDASSGVVRQTGEVSEKLQANVVVLFEQQREQAAAMLHARESLDEATHRTRTLIDESANAFDKARLAASDFSAAGVALRQTAETARSQAESSRGASSMMAETTSRLQEVAVTHRNLLDQHQQVFERVERGLAQTLGQVDSALKNYHAQSNEALQSQLQTFDAHLANAVKRIGTLVEELGEGLQGLEDALDGAAQRLSSGNASAARA